MEEWFTVGVETSCFLWRWPWLSLSLPFLLQLLPVLFLVHLPRLCCQKLFLWAARLGARPGATCCMTAGPREPRRALDRVDGLRRKVSTVTGVLDRVFRRTGGGSHAEEWVEIGWHGYGVERLLGWCLLLIVKIWCWWSLARWPLNFGEIEVRRSKNDWLFLFLFRTCFARLTTTSASLWTWERRKYTSFRQGRQLVYLI